MHQPQKLKMESYLKQSERTGISPWDVEGGTMEQKKETPRRWERWEIEGEKVDLRGLIGGNKTTTEEENPEVNPKLKWQSHSRRWWEARTPAANIGSSFWKKGAARR